MLKYWIWLATRKGLNAYSACQTARYFGTAEAAYLASEEEYNQVEGLKNKTSLLDKDLTEAEQILVRCYNLGISILTMQDAAYPQRLLVCDDAPVVLYYKGTLPDFQGPAVAVVGTRKASAYGLRQARRLGFGLARGGCMVVTGGAKGIDTEALKGALTGGGSVTVVLGCGVDVVYPVQNKQLFEDVVWHGCIMSEYPPGTPPHAGNFPVRNRIISGLTLGVLVAEAPERSGALITARLALEQGRDVFTLPANVGVDSCAGNLRLLRDGAIPVGEAWDILQEYAALYPDKLQKQASAPQLPPEEKQKPEVKPAVESTKVVDKPAQRAYIDVKDVMDAVSEDERLLLQLLQNGPVHIDVLAEQSQLGTSRALASLTLLEVKGMVQRPSPRLYELQLAGK